MKFIQTHSIEQQNKCCAPVDCRQTMYAYVFQNNYLWDLCTYIFISYIIITAELSTYHFMNVYVQFNYVHAVVLFNMNIMNIV